MFFSNYAATMTPVKKTFGKEDGKKDMITVEVKKKSSRRRYMNKGDMKKGGHQKIL